MTFSLDNNLPGHVVRSTHLATARSILGSRNVPIVSKGQRFYTEAMFFWRRVLGYLCERDQNLPLTVAEVRGWTFDPIPTRITIAETPDIVPNRYYGALIGGIVHECLHVLNSGQDVIDAVYVVRILAPEIKGLDLKPHEHLLCDLQNVFEDIAIEHIGGAKFPGSVDKLVALADLILEQEAPQRDQFPVTSLALCAMRDAGLGYDTDAHREARDAYEAHEAWPMIEQVLLPFAYEARPDTSDLVRARRSIWTDGHTAVLALRALREILRVMNLPENGDGGSEQGEPETGETKPGDTEMISPAEGEGSAQPTPTQPKDGDDQENGMGEGDSQPKPMIAEGTNTESDAERDRVGQGAGGGVGIGVTLGEMLRDWQDNPPFRVEVGDALQLVLQNVTQQLQAQLKRGEAPYRPYSTAFDIVCKPSPESYPEGYNDVLNDARASTRTLRAKLQYTFRNPDTDIPEDGVPRGKYISARHLPDTRIAIIAGQSPRHGFREVTPEIDTSLVAAVVVDESSSMRPHLVGVAALLRVLVESHEMIGGKVAAIGIRSHRTTQYPEGDTIDGYHRNHPVAYDIFKGFDQRGEQVFRNLSGVTANGGTPLADGVEYGLNLLAPRRERYRILYVLTDGVPNDKHAPVIRYQVKRAQSQGMMVVGVGIGAGCQPVLKLFPESIYGETLDEIPPQLIALLLQLKRRA